jgi:Methyltransferase domain
LLDDATSMLKTAEAVAGETKDAVQALHRLRALSLDDFGLFLLGLPDPDYPALSALLPRMASDEVQKSWTGADGRALMTQTLTFVRLVGQNFQSITGEPLHQHAILDFGCGWGRIIRMLYYFSDPALIYGCDPWDKSIQICRDDRVLGNLAVSDYLPQRLPFERRQFDLVLAFSVFTHLSERAAATALEVLGGALSERGLLAITIRPVEYWRIHKGLSASDRAALEAAHAARGFAYRPHNRAPVDGDITYGDTSMTLDYFAQHFPWLAIRKVERPAEDPYQTVLFLTKQSGA